MTDDRTNMGDRLLAVEPASADARRQLQQELHAMFVKELTTPRRVIMGIVALAALASAGLCGFLAVTEPELPVLARVGLAVGTLFGLAWSLLAGRACWRGSMNPRVDGRRGAAMAWVFTVLMTTFFLMVGMSIEDRLLGVMMIVQSLAFLIGAAVVWLTYRIEEAELNTREKLLQLELRLAELADRQSSRST